MLQLLGSLAVLATGGVLYLFEQNQTDAVLIIINSVALAFILEVDNKIGHILNLRGECCGGSSPLQLSTHKGQPASQPASQLAPACVC